MVPEPGSDGGGDAEDEDASVPGPHCLATALNHSFNLAPPRHTSLQQVQHVGVLASICFRGRGSGSTTRPPRPRWQRRFSP